MIWLYSGTPGSGKSYHAVRDIVFRLKKKRGFNSVIANFPIDFPKSNFKYMNNAEMTVESFYNHATENHKIGIEGQTLVVIDEAQIIFNSRNWNSNGGERMRWIEFFSQHRKLGYNFILIAQFDRMLDRQIRCLIEYEVAHLKVNNYFRIIPITTFLAVQRWYGQKLKVGVEYIFYRKSIANYYDTMALFNNKDYQLNLPVGAGMGLEGPEPATAGSEAECPILD